MWTSKLFTNIKYLNHLGSGSHGEIGKYKLPNGQFVAIKEFFPNENDDLRPESITELYMYQILKQCPNIIHALDVKLSFGTEICLLLMMPYFQTDLYNYISSRSFLDRLKFATPIISQLLSGLYHLHSLNIIHRDMKPENIFINVKDMVVQVAIADFGISIQLPNNPKYRITPLSTDVYALLYKPPEILAARTNYNEKADIWGLGLIILEYFIGHTLLIDSETIDDYNVQQQILTYLTQHANNMNVNEIHDHIDVERILKLNLNSSDYSKISVTDIDMLNSMLSVNPDDRVLISDLISPLPSCESNALTQKRGIPIDIDVKTSYYIIREIIIVCTEFKYGAKTTISAIDLLERYLHNFRVGSKSGNMEELKTDDDVSIIRFSTDIILIIASCILLMSKQNEGFGTDLNDYVFEFRGAFTVDDLKQTEVQILKNMNFLIMSADIDEYVYEFTKHPDYSQLLKTYYDIANNGYYAANLSYSEIITGFKSNLV